MFFSSFKNLYLLTLFYSELSFASLLQNRNEIHFSHGTTPLRDKKYRKVRDHCHYTGETEVLRA